MKHTKRVISAVLATALCLMPMRAGAARAAQVQSGGYENGNGLDLNKIGSYISGISNPDGGVAEIVSYDARANKAWAVNGATGMLDILDLNSMEGGVISAESLDIKALTARMMPEFTYGDMTSVSVCSERGLVAVALQAADYDSAGYVGILNTNGELLTMIEAGFQPDMVTFTPDGTKILVANEGEPRNGYGEGIVDPAGSVTIVDVASETAVNAGFEAFDEKRDELTASGVMLTRGNVPSVDFEPEYIACDNGTAYITLQEANAVAVLDLTTGAYRGVYSLGYQDLSLEENALDLVEDGVYTANTYSDTVAAYMPDGIAMYEADGKTYLVTANEGDAREWGDEEASTDFCNEIKETLTAADGTEAKKVRVIDPEMTDGMPEGKSVLFSSRSFSIYRVDEDGLTQVFDSGKDFEALTARYIPEYFNCSNDDNDYDSRSPKKGPEPENVTVGAVNGQLYAFVGLERIGGIMVYRIDNENAAFVNYINTRDFSENPGEAKPSLNSDVAPEGLCFIPSSGILLAAFEVSGTVSAYSVAESAKQPTIFEDVDAAGIHKDYAEAIAWAASEEITLGVDDFHFNPDGTCTRGEAVTFLWRASGKPAPSITDTAFADLDDSAFYYDAVLWAFENDITNGTSETTFSPNEVCNRAQIVTFLWRANGESAPASSDCRFTDVEDGSFYCDAVQWAFENGVTKGTGETTFTPAAPCTRAQTVTFLYRARP